MADDLHTATFTWPSTDAEEVILTGSFDNWSKSVVLKKTEYGFTGTIQVPWGSETQYIYVVDGEWITCREQPVTLDGSNDNNIYTAPPRPAPVPEPKSLITATASGPTFVTESSSLDLEPPGLVNSMGVPTAPLPDSSASGPSDTSELFDRTQILEAVTSGLPKLKEQNYSYWKVVLSDAIKAAELWGYVDGSIVRPPATSLAEYKKYARESAAVRRAIFDALEPGVHKYLDGTVTPHQAWLALEQHYQLSDDAYFVSVEQRLSELKLPEDGDVIEHIAIFCRLRRLLADTRFAMSDQASIEMLYCSLPASYRQWTLVQEQVEIKDFALLCSRLKTRYRDAKFTLIQNSSSTPATELSPPETTVDQSVWGVPDDIRSFKLTGNKNPLLDDRAKITCRDCLLKDHKAGTPECPQFAWRREIWGDMVEDSNAIERQSGTSNGLNGHPDLSESHLSHVVGPCNNAVDARTSSSDTRIKNGLVYELSEALQIISRFEELGLEESQLRHIQSHGFNRPSEIQQCGILPIIRGRDVIAQSQPTSGKTAALAISILRTIDMALRETQVLVLTSTQRSAIRFKSTVLELGNGTQCHAYTGDTMIGEHLYQQSQNYSRHIVASTPRHIIDMVNRGILNLRNVRMLALDDADEIVNEGFKDQILDIHRILIPSAQVVVLSTSLPSIVLEVATKLTKHPVRIDVCRDQSLPEGVSQYFLIVGNQDQKPATLAKLYDTLDARQLRTVIFCHAPGTVTYLASSYRNYSNPWHNPNNFTSRPIIPMVSNPSEQKEREAVMHKFCDIRNHHGLTLITSDAWMRGCSTQRISLVINYDVPKVSSDYKDRISCFGRFGHKCTVISLVTPEEVRVIQDIEQCYDIQIPEVKDSELRRVRYP